MSLKRKLPWYVLFVHSLPLYQTNPFSRWLTFRPALQCGPLEHPITVVWTAMLNGGYTTLSMNSFVPSWDWTLHCASHIFTSDPAAIFGSIPDLLDFPVAQPLSAKAVFRREFFQSLPFDTCQKMVPPKNHETMCLFHVLQWHSCCWDRLPMVQSLQITLPQLLGRPSIMTEPTDQLYSRTFCWEATIIPPVWLIAESVWLDGRLACCSER